MVSIELDRLLASVGVEGSCTGLNREALEALLKVALQEEREACAVLAVECGYLSGEAACWDIASSIRARGGQ